MFLNNIASHEKYRKISTTTYFVDKTMLLRELIQEFSEEQPYICITRPRRFGKTIMANMIAAFFGKALDSSQVFDKLEIAKYSDGSELNMFKEYDMSTKIKFSQYFGFQEREVDMLYERYETSNGQLRVSREELKEWYDGYQTSLGERIYNPRSVVCALVDNQLANYWTSSGTYDSVFYYIKDNIAEVQDDLALMVSGEGVETRIQEYSATAQCLETKAEIYSAMVVYGLLTYKDGKVFIPNKELMMKFEELLMNKSSLGYVYCLAKESSRMLRATLEGDTDSMAEILQYAHNTETPILSYNNETELAAVVNLVYLSARDKYRVERENKAGKGYVDFIFYPLKPMDDGIILELKVDSTPEEAIRQIREREYPLHFLGKIVL